MATKSMYKNIKIKNKAFAQSFVCALENAKKFTSEEGTPDVKMEDVKKEKIKEFFSDIKIG